MFHRIRIILPVFTLLTWLFTLHPSHAASIQLPQTGQTGCWNTVGTAITCTATGQDGDKLAGVAPPNPRFTDNSNGTVTDNLTGLIWLTNANCFGAIFTTTGGAMTWQNALGESNNLASGSCGLTDGSAVGSWRLPNITELESLVDAQNAYPALPTGHPFISVQASYWSSSSYVGYKYLAWVVSMVGGGVSGSSKTGGYYVWPVRGGQ